MASFNTVTYPTQESSVTNVGGDYLTYHTQNIVIIQYHMHAPAVASVDRDHTGERVALFVHVIVFVLIAFCMDTGTTEGDQSGALPQAAQNADVVVSVSPFHIFLDALYNIGPDKYCLAQRAPLSVWRRFLSIFGF